MQPARSSSERGYGYAHRKARAAALKAMHDGDACCRCGGPMYRGQLVDLDHTDDRAGYNGLAHQTCNRSAGASRGNRTRGATPIPRQSRVW